MLRGYFLNVGGEGSSGPQTMADGLLTSLVVCQDATCNQTVMSGVIDENKAENVDEFGDDW